MPRPVAAPGGVAHRLGTAGDQPWPISLSSSDRASLTASGSRPSETTARGHPRRLEAAIGHEQEQSQVGARQRIPGLRRDPLLRHEGAGRLRCIAGVGVDHADADHPGGAVRHRRPDGLEDIQRRILHRRQATGRQSEAHAVSEYFPRYFHVCFIRFRHSGSGFVTRGGKRPGIDVAVADRPGACPSADRYGRMRGIRASE